MTYLLTNYWSAAMPSMCTLLRSQSPTKMEVKSTTVCFFFSAVFRRTGDLQQSVHEKRQIMTWFEVWPQCGESLFESGLLQIKTDLLLPLNLVSKITQCSEHGRNARNLKVLFSHQSVMRNCLQRTLVIKANTCNDDTEGINLPLSHPINNKQRN